MEIPDSVTNIEENAFFACKKLKFVTYRGTTFFSSETEKDILDGILYMLINRDFLWEDDNKYIAIQSIFRKSFENESANAYVKENFDAMFPFLIDMEEMEIIQKILDSKEFITKQNIDRFIQYAIDNRKYQPQLLLTDYKYQYFDFKSPADKLRL